MIQKLLLFHPIHSWRNGILSLLSLHSKARLHYQSKSTTSADQILIFQFPGSDETRVFQMGLSVIIFSKLSQGKQAFEDSIPSGTCVAASYILWGKEWPDV